MQTRSYLLNFRWCDGCSGLICSLSNEDLEKVRETISATNTQEGSGDSLPFWEEPVSLSKVSGGLNLLETLTEIAFQSKCED